MTIGDWIAGYAAVVATVAVIWQAMTYWLARRPRLTLQFEPVIFVKSRQGQRSLLAVFEGRSANATDINWFFDLRLMNEGRSRIQITGLSISQANSAGARYWDATSRFGNGTWLEPGETDSYRFTDTDLADSSLGEPFRVIVRTSPDRRFEITAKLIDGKTAIALPYQDAKEMWTKLGIDESKIYVLETTDIE